MPEPGRPRPALARRAFLAWTGVALATACASEPHGTDADAPPSAGASSIPSAGWSVSPTPHVEIGVLDGDPAYQFQDVSAAALQADGDVVVADAGTSEVRLYSAEGAFVRLVGGPGAAPGEFRRPVRLLIGDSDSITVWDESAWRLTRFGPGGELGPVHNLSTRIVSELSSPPVYPVAAWPVAGPALLVRLEDKVGGKGGGGSGSGETSRPDGTLLVVSLDLDDPVTLGSFAGREEVTVDSPWGPLPMARPFGRRLATAVHPRDPRVCAGDQAIAEVRCYDGAGAETVLRWQAESVPVDPGDPEVDRWREETIASYAGKLSRDEARRLVDAAPLPDSLPPYGSLALDRRGTLWVETGRPRAGPGGERGRPHLVFAADGSLLGDVWLPEIRVLEIGDDYVLGVRVDELGVQFVGRYALARGR